MIKTILGKKLGELVSRIGSRPSPGDDLVSTQVIDTGPAVEDTGELLRSCGRMVCRVLTQVVRRAGFDASLFLMTVEFHDQKTLSFRVLTEMPTSSALTHLQCKEIEHTARIELEMRYEIQLRTIYWRIKDTDPLSLPLSGLKSKLQKDATTDSSLARKTRSGLNGYPAPVRMMMDPAQDGLLVTHDREGTPSEIEEFHGLLAQSSTPTAP